MSLYYVPQFDKWCHLYSLYEELEKFYTIRIKLIVCLILISTLYTADKYTYSTLISALSFSLSF